MEVREFIQQIKNLPKGKRIVFDGYAKFIIENVGGYYDLCTYVQDTEFDEIVPIGDRLCLYCDGQFVAKIDQCVIRKAEVVL